MFEIVEIYDVVVLLGLREGISEFLCQPYELTQRSSGIAHLLHYDPGGFRKEGSVQRFQLTLYIISLALDRILHFRIDVGILLATR